MPTKKHTPPADEAGEEREVQEQATSEITEEESAVAEVKPKRKYVRKKKAVEEQVARRIDAVEQLEPVPETVAETETEPEGEVIDEEPMQRTPRSIKPVHARALHQQGETHTANRIIPFHSKMTEDRVEHVAVSSPVIPSEEVSSAAAELEKIRSRMKQNKDAQFLVPDTMGFDLKAKQQARKSKTRWFKGFLYFTGTLIILSAVSLFLLSMYSTQFLNAPEETIPTATEETETPAVTEEQSSVRYAIMNAQDTVKSKLSGLISSKFGDGLSLDPSTTPTLSQVTVDTLFYATEAKDQAGLLEKFLAEQGIVPKLQINDEMGVDIALYMVTTIAQPDLSGNTAVVYNATSTTGLAKKNCDLLTKYKVESCQAMNATTPETGTTVLYKDNKAYFTLIRTTEFKGAKFEVAPTTQTEDIRVTIGN